ncbi:hypothetical protein HPB50_011769 [Hyalomma asiaticum]|uniref:Uncharacterized protein n=1 Tax=Hyalomma asiaticum TaxID=266040 RepID=A0ACB7TJ32_HYAAI|nr:hypothetical protein HPB50_011769 [Hyalomma asiaticum]
MEGENAPTQLVARRNLIDRCERILSEVIVPPRRLTNSRSVRAFTSKSVSAGIYDVLWKPKDMMTTDPSRLPATTPKEPCRQAKSNLERRPERPILNPSKSHKAPLPPEELTQWRSPPQL